MQNWKEWRDLSPGPRPNQIPSDRAWRLFADWLASAKELSLLFISQTGNFRASARLTCARNGTIALTAEPTSASFDLKDATFLYGPMPVWPRWPNPPVIETLALNVLLPHGAWLCIAEGLTPPPLPDRFLPV